MFSSGKIYINASRFISKMVIDINPAALIGLRLVLGIVFFVSGLLKLPDLKGFYIIVVRFNIIKGLLAKSFAYALPFAEIVIGFSLIFAYQVKIASIIALIMLINSTFALIYVLIKKKKLDNCGCYGTALKVPVSWGKVIENLVWLILTILLVIGSL